MVTIRTEYLGDLRTLNTHDPSGSTLLTDAPSDNQGKGEAFSPTDLVVTALSSCVLTILGIVALRHDWDLRGATGTATKHMLTGVERRIGRIELAFELPGHLDERARKTLEAAVHGCPVDRSLHPDLEIDMTFTYTA